MKRKEMEDRQRREIVFLPALTPMEAAVLPAREKPRRMGALDLVPYAWEAAKRNQRAKIWVR